MEELLSKINSLYEKGGIKNQLQQLTINYFRSFEKNTVIKFDHPLAVLVGKNGTGKSTALKLLKALSTNRKPNDYFFESATDPEDTEKEYIFSFEIDGNTYINFKKKKQWLMIDDLTELDKLNTSQEIYSYLKTKKLCKPSIVINDIEFKALIGAFDKSLFFDNISRSKNMDKKISYTVKQSAKLMQNKMNKSSNKTAIYLSEGELKEVNYILGRSYKSITIYKHRYFNGTWGTTVLFENDMVYSEFNSGSGEFIISITINKIKTLPNNSILLLDEPEISIHPGAQKRFMVYLLKTILAKKLQVIISTHSPTIIEKLPNSCIKNFTINGDNKIEVSNSANYLEAFYNLECSFDKKNIIVEDDLSKDILLSICAEEKYSNLFDINFFPGGAESIKTLIITAFSKSDTKNSFIIFDGDKYIKNVVELKAISEINKDIGFYKNEFQSTTGVNSSTVKWGINGNKNNNDQKQKDLELSELIIKYLNFYKNNVCFFPEQVPEQIIFDLDYAKNAFGYLNLSEIEQTNNFKEKFLKLSCLTGIDIKSLEKIFISYFVKQKKVSENYQRLKAILDEILSR
ncbi:ATP-dependent nuclease [Clostridium estertheticum]|uniref:AAA family ATPase n=1 Tax=Clostridium estertheticum TaxID=238834 RepID=A0A7Y3SWB5_9CLOT|nr:AAA family ATPase [Clostridium estertheticum]NNU76568.1 AAA family ATPase [Clostridium estertheticum]WBL49706.1 AAA family ATPase [Clostridium estertheticum]